MIAFDATSSGVNTASSPLTWTHTCTGRDGALVVSACNGAASPTLTSVSYGGFPMTQITAGVVSSGDIITLWILLSPPTGANTVSVAFAGTGPNCNGGATSYTGVRQVLQPDASNSISAQLSTNPTISVTTVKDNCWVVGVAGVANGTPTAALTSRAAFAYGGSGTLHANIEDTNAVKSPQGAQTVNWTAASNFWGVIAFSLSPSSNHDIGFINNKLRPHIFSPGVAR